MVCILIMRLLVVVDVGGFDGERKLLCEFYCWIVVFVILDGGFDRIFNGSF